jgi:hypothetical protein
MLPELVLVEYKTRGQKKYKSLQSWKYKIFDESWENRIRKPEIISWRNKTTFSL